MKKTKRKPPRPAKRPAPNLPAYDPYNLNKALAKGEVSMKEVRKEYSRLRDILRKRVLRMKGSIFKESSFVHYNEHIPTLKGLTPSEVRYGLADMWQALNRKDSSIGGQYKVYQERADWLNLNYGLTITTPQELESFGRMMNWIRAAYKDRLYSSDQAVQLISKEGIQDLYREFVKAGLENEPVSFAEGTDKPDISNSFNARLQKLLSQQVKA